tara:strand:- start:6771 stop:7592 length:822 start_codon:yes stop_codon:yes gene_type:complete
MTTSKNTAFEKIQPNLNKVAQNLNNYIVSPLQRLGIAGFNFDKVINSNLKEVSRYTTNYVEDGTYITDHVVFEPKRITMTGFVFEKAYNSQSDPNLLERLTQKLTVLTVAIPKLTEGMQQLKNTTDQAQKKDIQNTVNSAVDFWNTVKELNPSDRASGKAYSYLKALWQTSTILSLTEPDGTYHKNMVITSVDKKTRENTFDAIDFVVELQEWRIAETLFETIDASNFAGRASEENTGATSQGKVQGETTDKTPISIIRDIGGEKIANIIQNI